MNTLFVSEFFMHDQIRILELSETDIKSKSDFYRLIYGLIQNHECNYPDIKRWFDTKVISGVKEKESAVYVGFKDEIPFATSIVNKLRHSKFCLLHIDESMRNRYVSDILSLY